jgi:UDP-2,3-diacylglucosamine pyrophosphatase LpxH
VVRALVISDTHFGAWTGEDILRNPENLALLEPHLDVDEVIVLGDLFDFLFASEREAFAAASPLLNLLRERLQGKKLVFLAGNHDHHIVTREEHRRIESELLGEEAAPERIAGRRGDFFLRALERRMEGVELEATYPTYTFAGVLLTHGHYLDIHANRRGSRPTRLLSRTIWSIAIGGEERTPTIDDYEATITLLTELLYTIAQVPNGTHAQRSTFEAFQRLGRAKHISAFPLRASERASIWAKSRLQRMGDRDPAMMGDMGAADYEGAMAHERERRRRTGAPAGGEITSRALARQVSPSDPAGRAVAAFEQVVTNLGWAPQSNQVVFAHTHQPLDGVLGPAGQIRYWNTGSWIYEPDLSSPEAYAAYLRNAWPGTAVLIDSEAGEPRLLRLREDLSPLHR